MGLNKIIRKLTGLLDEGEDQRRIRKENDVRILLEKLQRKEEKLREKIGRAESAKERERLERRLKVAQAHAKKAREFLEG